MSGVEWRSRSSMASDECDPQSHVLLSCGLQATKTNPINFPFIFAGYVYMNGELGKAPASTAIYTNAIEPAAMMAPVLQPTMVQATLVPTQTLSAADYGLVNGNIAIATANDTAGAEYYQQQTGDGSVMGATAINDHMASGSGGTIAENGIPLDQLKQMLTAQLEYYFSR